MKKYAIMEGGAVVEEGEALVPQEAFYEFCLRLGYESEYEMELDLGPQTPELVELA